MTRTFDPSAEPQPSYVATSTIAMSSIGTLAGGFAAAVLIWATATSPPTAQGKGIAIGVQTPPSLIYSNVAAARAATDLKLVELGTPPNLMTDALEFSRRAAEEGLALPLPRLTADGEVMFYWRRDKIYLDVGINGDGTYSFFCRDATGHESLSGDDVEISDGVDAQLARVIRSIG